MSRRTSVAQWALLLAAVLGSPLARSTTGAYVDSPAGDYVGQGQQYTYVDPVPTVTGFIQNDGRLHVLFESWELVVGATYGDALVAGVYEGTRVGTLNSSGPYPYLQFMRFPRTCPSAKGWFVLHEIAVSGTTVTTLAVDFLQSCSGAAALFGAIRLNSSIALLQPEPYARVPDDLVETEGELVTLDGSASFDRAGSIVSYQWAQISGTAVALDDPTAAIPTFTAPDVAAGGETLQFRLTVTDADGSTGSRSVDVLVHDVADRRNIAALFGQMGSTAPGARWYDEGTSALDVYRSYSSGISLRVDAEEGWGAWLRFPQGAAVRTGAFAGSVQFGFNGNGCTSASSWMQIHEIEIVDNVVTRLAADFVLTCPLSEAWQAGAIRLDSSVPIDLQGPLALVPSWEATEEGETFTLDASGSLGLVDPALSYQWVQTGGTAVALTNASGAVATFTAPAVVPGGETLTFMVTVTDSTGGVGTAIVTVRVRDATDLRTRVLIEAEPQVHYFSRLSYHEDNAVVTAEHFAYAGFQPVIQVRIDRQESPYAFTARFGVPTGKPASGKYVVDVPYFTPGQGMIYFGTGYPGANETEQGWFELIELEMSGGQVTKLAVDFRRGTTLLGAIRINSNVPIERAVSYAAAGRDFPVLEGRELQVDGAYSHSRVEGALQYQWSQLAGPPATILEPNSAATAVSYGDIPLAGATYTFALEVTDPAGRVNVDTVDVRVLSREAPQTYLVIESDPDHYVTQGVPRFFWTEIDNFGAATSSSLDRLIASVRNNYWWDLDFRAPDGEALAPGLYEVPTDGSQLWFSGEHRGCNYFSPAWFRVMKLESASPYGVAKAAVDFEQVCDDGHTARGRLRVNVAPAEEPVADAGADVEVDEGQPVSLDGSQSSDREGALSYAWVQRSGPAVVLTGASGATPAFVAPAVVEGSEQSYAFELTVTDSDGFLALDSVAVRVLQTPDSDGDGVRDGFDALPFDPTETVDTDADAIGNNADTDDDNDGVEDAQDSFPTDAAESSDTDTDGIGDNADTDDDGDGYGDAVEALAPDGDGNLDGIADALQADVVSLMDSSGAAATFEVMGGTVHAVTAVENPDPAGAPANVTFDRGFFALEIDVAPGGAATAVLILHDGPVPDSYYKFDPLSGAFYRFLYDGTTGAQVLVDRVVLHFVDGGIGDGDHTADGRIRDPGAPAWTAPVIDPPLPKGGGGSMPAGALLMLAVAALRRRRHAI